MLPPPKWLRIARALGSPFRINRRINSKGLCGRKGYVHYRSSANFCERPRVSTRVFVPRALIDEGEDEDVSGHPSDDDAERGQAFTR